MFRLPSFLKFDRRIRAVARRDNWGGGGGCIFIFKRNPSGRTRIYEYAPPPIIGLATALRRINNALYILRVIVPRHGSVSVGSVGPDYFHCVVIPLNAVKSE
jgi:hypothetical protein